HKRYELLSERRITVWLVSLYWKRKLIGVQSTVSIKSKIHDFINLQIAIDRMWGQKFNSTV
ncbi:MAG: hypothetical protein RSF68_01020, partial [Myroides sp.]